MRIELTRAILILALLSNFLRTPTVNFPMFVYLVICFLRVTVSVLCRLQAVWKMHFPIYPSLICEGRRNCSNLWLASNETATVRKHIKYKHMRKSMVEFLRKFWENLKITLQARGRVGRVTDCWVRGLWFKSPGSILTSRTETSSLSRVVWDGLRPMLCTGKWVKKIVSYGGVFDLAVQQPQLFRKLS